MQVLSDNFSFIGLGALLDYYNVIGLILIVSESMGDYQIVDNRDDFISIGA